jgi:hypothetical protein
MAKVGVQNDDDAVPSYEESLREENRRQRVAADSKTTPFQSQIASTRARRINTLLGNHVHPQIANQVVDGILRWTFILVPSDELRDAQTLSKSNLAGIPEDVVNPIVVRLVGQENPAAFWQQPAVVQQLAAELRSNLASSGHLTEEPSELPQLPPRPTAAAAPAMISTLSRKTSDSSQTYDPTGTTNHWRLGWRTDAESGNSRPPLRADEARVTTETRDTSFTTESELGLLLAETVKCLWLDVELGG